MCEKREPGYRDPAMYGLSTEEVEDFQDIISEATKEEIRAGGWETCDTCGASHRSHRRRIPFMGSSMRCPDEWHRDRQKLKALPEDESEARQVAIRRAINHGDAVVVASSAWDSAKRFFS